MSSDRRPEWLPPSGESAVLEMTDQMSEAGLEPPPVPDCLRERFRSSVDGWAWSSTDEVPSASVYYFGIFKERFSFERMWAPDSEDFFLVGHRGHGFNSYGLGLHLRLGSVAVSVQHLWGGAFGDEEAESVAVNRSHRLLGSLLEDLPRGFDSEPLRWAVVFSDFREYAGIFAPGEIHPLLGGRAGLEVAGWRPVAFGHTGDFTMVAMEALDSETESDEVGSTLLALGRFLTHLRGERGLGTP